MTIDPFELELLNRIERLMREGNAPQALNACNSALRELPDSPMLLAAKSRCHFVLQQLPEAIAAGQHSVELAATAQSRAQLAWMLIASGNRAVALEQYRLAIDLEPESSEIHLRYAQCLQAAGQRQEAIAEFKVSLALDPEQSEAEIGWAEALVDLGNLEEAELHLKPAGGTDPVRATRHGVRLQVLGRFEAARECFEHSLSLLPFQGAAYYWLVRGQRITEKDRVLVDRMQQLAREPRLPMPEKVYLQYALGKAREDLGEYRLAIQHFDEANGMARVVRGIRFNADALVGYNDWRIRAFQPEPLHQFQAFGSSSELPVFVVGMIRSGTTLVEQLLSNHPDIEGCGELLFWNERQEQINSSIAKGTIDANLISSTAQDYLDQLRQFAPAAKRTIDKMPLNTFLVGPIHLVFPNAKFIHVNRSPKDTCLSIYTTNFESSPDFAHDQENIAFYYREYQRLMEHWRSLLPADRFLDIQYEELIDDPEATLRKVLQFIGLPWHESCTHPESNRRAVRTPSAWQVRQPIYQSSSERWRKFQPWLGAIADLT